MGISDIIESMQVALLLRASCVLRNMLSLSCYYDLIIITWPKHQRIGEDVVNNNNNDVTINANKEWKDVQKKTIHCTNVLDQYILLLFWFYLYISVDKFFGLSHSMEFF